MKLLQSSGKPRLLHNVFIERARGAIALRVRFFYYDTLLLNEYLHSEVSSVGREQ